MRDLVDRPGLWNDEIPTKEEELTWTQVGGTPKEGAISLATVGEINTLSSTALASSSRPIW